MNIPSADFRVNQPQVISQTIDGEAVVINLQSGTYYSLAGSAGAIWKAVELGLASREIPAWLATQYADVGADLEKMTFAFLAELAAEALIVPAPATAAPPVPSAAVERAIFTPPLIAKFTDMQELLLLDPIHEVDATGWPQAKPAADGQ